VKLNCDYLAVSFPKSGADMLHGARADARRGRRAFLIAKIERAEASRQSALVDIMHGSDGIMVARGDLAVEVGDASVAGAAEEDDPPRARATTSSHHRHADDGSR